MKKIIAILCTATLLISLSACNTVKGVGTDIKKGGAAIERAADK